MRWNKALTCNDLRGVSQVSNRYRKTAGLTVFVNPADKERRWPCGLALLNRGRRRRERLGRGCVRRVLPDRAGRVHRERAVARRAERGRNGRRAIRGLRRGAVAVVLPGRRASARREHVVVAALLGRRDREVGRQERLGAAGGRNTERRERDGIAVVAAGRGIRNLAADDRAERADGRRFVT